MQRYRGLIWVAVGAVLQVWGMVTGRPLVVRGTHVPWALAVIGVGLMLMAWDGWRKNRGA